MGSHGDKIGISGSARVGCVAWTDVYLCACVSEERGDGEGAGSQALSDTCRYINLTELALGQFALRGRVTSRRQFSKSCMFLFLK